MKLSMTGFLRLRRFRAAASCYAWTYALTIVLGLVILAGWLIPSDYIDSLYMELSPPYDDLVRQSWTVARSPILVVVLLAVLVFGLPRGVRIRRLLSRRRERREFELALPGRMTVDETSYRGSVKLQWAMLVWTIFRLRQRAIALRRQSTAILVMIAFSIASGIGVIIFAGYLTSIDSSGTAVQKAEAIVESLERSIERANSRLRTAKQNLEALSDSSASQSTTKADESSRPPRPQPTRQSREQEVRALEESLALLKLRMKRAEKYLDQAYRSYFKVVSSAAPKKAPRSNDPSKAEPTQEADEDEIYGLSSQQQLLIASAITRFGVVAILLFFVGMLIGLYRYMSRLSAFYSARADALMLCAPSFERLISWMDLLAPKAIDFGRNPATPMDVAQRVATAVAAKLPFGQDKLK